MGEPYGGERRRLGATGALLVVAAMLVAAGARAEPAARGAAAQGPPSDPLAGVTGLPGPSGERLTIDTKGLTLRFPDSTGDAAVGNDAATWRVGGRLQLDFGAAYVRPRGFDDVFPDNAAVRRAWIEPHLSLRGGFEFAFQYDFANARTPIFDALVAYRGLEPFVVTVGNMKEPLLLDRLTGNADLLFTERALPDAFNPARSFGVAVGAGGERWTATAGAYGRNANLGIADDGVAGVARATYAPILREAEVLHLGVAGGYRALDRRGPDLSFGSQPEAFLFAERRELVDTGPIADATAVRRAGLEAAYRHGPLLVQAEYVRTGVDRAGGLPALGFQGGYVQAGLVLNGAGRGYKLKPDYATSYAVFGGVEVVEAQRVSRGGVGVFEIGARFSALDLADGAVRGGVERDVTVGLNWYPERNVKLMIDYVRARTDRPAMAADRVTEADIVIGRLQFHW